MKLTFLGTRANTDATSPDHRRHTATRVAYRGRSVLVDCGEDWRQELDRLRPRALVLTHAHADHVGGLAGGAPCPVWATEETWRRIGRYPIAERRTVEPGRPFLVEGIRFEALPVEHSLRAPAVGYRIVAGRVTIFYVSDLAALPEPRRALAGVRLYVGDGASLTRPILRYEGTVRCGHTTVREQLATCAEQGVRRAIFTHCGSQIVEGDELQMNRRVRELGAASGVEAALARDGLEVVLR